MKDSFYRIVVCFVVSVFSLHVAKAQLGAQVNTHNTTCGMNNGSVQVNASGGAGYTYAWSVAGVPNTVDTLSGLPSGNYSVTVYSGGASVVKAFVIGASAGPASLNSTIQPTCGQNNGAINCSVTSSGFTTQLFRNDTLVQFGTQTQFANLAPGTYLFIVNSPGSACPVDTLPAIILSDNSAYPRIDSAQITPEKCFGAKQGAVTVFVSNCTGGCTYSWTGIPGNTTTSATGIGAGTYTFNVSGGGCTNVDTIITVPGPLGPLADNLSTHTSSCGQSNGIAVAGVTGGTPPYTYLWSAGTPTSDSAINLPGNSQVYLTVTDSHGCTLLDTGSISSVPRPVIAVTPPQPICQGDNNGLIIVTPISGQAPLSYIWSNAETTNINAGLSPGLYSLTVTDAVGCDTVLLVTVPAYQGQLSVTYITGPTVAYGQTADILLNVNVPVTDVQWSPYIPGANGNLNVAFRAFQDSVYTVIVTTGKGCKLYDTIKIYVSPVNNGDEWTIPNTFTPNGDHINDDFKIIGNPYVSSFHIWIFDRWGNKVFESTHADFLWNGTNQFDGEKPFNSGVFSYVIEYQKLDSDSGGKIGGNITLIK